MGAASQTAAGDDRGPTDQIRGAGELEAPKDPAPTAPLRVTMLLENNPYPQDVRVGLEARALAAAGHYVRVIAPRAKGEPANEMIDDVRVERYALPTVDPASRRGMVLEYLVAHIQLYLRGLRALLRGTDVLHAHNPPDTLFPLGLVGRVLGCQFVFDQHDVFPELVTQKYSNRPLAAFARALQRLSVRTADLVITTNVTLREAALQTRRSSPDDVVIVRNGLTGTSLTRRREYRAGMLRDPRLVYVGELESQDGVDLLPEIVARLIEDHDLVGVQLTVVGGGSRLKPLIAAVKARGLGQHVQLTGTISHDRALEQMAGADICLDVAPCTEFNHLTTMVKIIEYLTLGRPVVSFPLTETIRLGGDAIAYAQCNDTASFARTVAELAASESLRQRLVERSEVAARGLVWERSAQALHEGYRRLASSRS